MSININGVGGSSVPGKVNGTADNTKLRSQEQTPTATESGKSSTSDTLSLSEGAKQLGKLENSAIAAPVIDAKRVAQVKAAIANGSYEINPAKIAGKLSQFEAMLKPKT